MQMPISKFKPIKNLKRTIEVPTGSWHKHNVLPLNKEKVVFFPLVTNSTILSLYFILENLITLALFYMVSRFPGSSMIKQGEPCEMVLRFRKSILLE